MKEKKVETKKLAKDKKNGEAKPQQKLDWETPKLEDVSDQVMAQPYIRFT